MKREGPLRVVNIVGARPNFMKIAPLYGEYAKHAGAIEPVLVHTGQHYDQDMSDVFLAQLGIPQPDFQLAVGSASQTAQVAKVMLAFEPVLEKVRPHVVLVVGDVNSTMACTLVAAKALVPVAHVEAGLRSFDRTMPEEINRIVTDALSSFLFTHSDEADENLAVEGVPPERVFQVGNVMIDTLRKLEPEAERSRIHEELGIAGTRYAFLTLHRPASVDDAAIFETLVGALEEVQRKLPIVWPVHPRTAKRLAEQGLERRLASLGRLIRTSPAGYVDSLALMARATIVLTDSGGVQEETTALGVPCLTLRTTTERPVTIREGTNVLVGYDRAAILDGVDGVLAGRPKKGRIPRLWDGRAAERIVGVLLDGGSAPPRT